MNTNYGTYDYLLSPNNNIVVHYELYEQPESEDRITPERKEIIINKLILHGDELEGLLENIQSDMELNYEKL